MRSPRRADKRAAGHLPIVLCAVVLVAMLSAPAAAAAASNWKLTQLPPKKLAESLPEEAQLSGVSCPTQSLCVAVGALDTIATSQSPTGGPAAWEVVYPTHPVEPGQNCSEGGGGPAVPCGNYLKGGLRAVSCASQNLCVAVGFEGTVDVSDDPTGGAGAWSMTNVNVAGGGATHLTGVSCPSTSLCVAVSGQGSGGSAGKVLTTTDPMSGIWTTAQLDSSLDFTGVSCGTPSLCVAVAREGRIAVSANPAGGGSAWSVVGAPGGAGDLGGVGCNSAPLCAAGNATGNILTSTDPTAPGGTWTETKAAGPVLVTGVSCPSASGCVAVDNNGDVLASADPTGGTGAWHAENLVPFEASEGEGQFPHNALFSASCASASLCALVGSDSRIFTSTTPFSATKPSGRSAHQAGRHVARRPRTLLVFAENFWRRDTTRHRRLRARFHFYSPTRVRGFECKRDRRRWRRCRSPLRYWAGIGRHVLRVRAIGPTGLRGRPAVKRFRILRRSRAAR